VVDGGRDRRDGGRDRRHDGRDRRDDGRDRRDDSKVRSGQVKQSEVGRREFEFPGWSYPVPSALTY